MVALAAYVIAVFARTSLSAMGVDAALRFGASPTILSLFTVLQLAVYAGMQVPAGTILDRVGARRSITFGSGLIALGLVVIAFATSVPVAILARVLIGTGDAFIFISVIRLLPAWFPARLVPLITQLTGMAGQLGQMLSLGPLVGLVLWKGWTAAFVAAGALTLLTGVLTLIIVRDGAGRVLLTLPETETPVTEPSATTPAPADVGTITPDVVERFAAPRERQSDVLVRTWRNPGTRAGFWIHFTAPFSAYTFTLLWGFAYMTEAEHVPESTALGVLSAYVLGCLFFSPVLGILTGKFASKRTGIVMTLISSHILAWTLVLVWPGGAPIWAFYLLAILLAAGGPASLIGFDFSRSTNPPERLGIATGMVNSGGFISTLCSVFLIGLMLEIQGQSSPDLFTHAGFSRAWLVQAPIWLLGLIMMHRSTRAYRRFLSRDDGA